MALSLSKLWEMVKDMDAWHAAVHGGSKKSDTTEWLNNNWTVLLKAVKMAFCILDIFITIFLNLSCLKIKYATESNFMLFWAY